MSLRIHKPGLLDTIQDTGRYGYQHLGINPGGVMDMYALSIANSLAGNYPHEAVLEMHFPAPVIGIDHDTILALSGADFTPLLNNKPVKVNSCIAVRAGSTLQFRKQVSGSRCYLAVKGGFKIPEWLGSKSTNVKAAGGGYSGRALKKDDVIELMLQTQVITFNPVMPWYANVNNLYTPGPIRFIAGAEYNALTTESQTMLLRSSFAVTKQSDRMGYRLQGPPLTTGKNSSLVSTGVSTGTIQLLPNGQLILLMADHQTTGGYPRIGHIISADIPSLAQKQPGESITFQQTGIDAAEELIYSHYLQLQQIRHACNFKMLAESSV